MSDVPSLDDFSEGIRYRRWDGTQRLDALEAEELLGAMSDELLAGGDLEDALARLSRWGIPGRMDGMKDLLERLRAAKQRRAERHDLSKVFDELKEKLDEVKRLEREGLERRRAAEAPDEQMRQAMQKLAQDRLAQLDALPQDFGRAMRALKDYEFVEPKAAEKYQELLKQLQVQVLGSYFKNMRDSLKNLTPEQHVLEVGAEHLLLQLLEQVLGSYFKNMLLGREVLERVAHVLEVGAEHLHLQLLEQLLVLLRCLRLHEFIVLERAHRAAEVLGQRVELREPILRELLHRLSHLLVRRLGGAPALETLTLAALHLIELLLELVEHLREIVALRAALLGRAEPLEQVLHAVHATGDAPTRQARERVL